MKAKAMILSTLSFAVATGFSLLFWRIYAHDLDYGIYFNDEYAYSEHFTIGFRRFTAVAPSLALGTFAAWLLAIVRQRFWAPHKSTSTTNDRDT
jgi:hypothetical protein